MKHDPDLLSEALPAVTDPIQRVETVQNAESDVFPFTLTVGAKIQQQHFIALLMKEPGMGGVVHGVAGKPVMENHQFPGRILSGETERMEPQPVPGTDEHVLKGLFFHPLSHGRHFHGIFRHLLRVGEFVNDILAGPFGARKRLAEQNSRGDPRCHPCGGHGSSGDQPYFCIFFHNIIPESCFLVMLLPAGHHGTECPDFVQSRSAVKNIPQQNHSSQYILLTSLCTKMRKGFEIITWFV